MAGKTSDLSSLTEQDWFVTEEEDLAIMENIAQTNFGMSLAEFRKAWMAGEFDDDQERHVEVISLAMMMPEYWIE